jgi:hypothetical protein
MKIEIQVPDEFTAEQVKEVKEFAIIKVERIVRATEVVPVEIKDGNDTKIDDLLVAMGLPTKYAVAEVVEVVEG